MPSDTRSRHVRRVLEYGMFHRSRCPQALTPKIVLIQYSVLTP